MNGLRLSIELVPNPLWGHSLYHLAPRREWDKLRKQVYARNNYQCEICEAGGRMICHEQWDYDDVNHIQRLTGFIALCDMCNNCKHMGRSVRLGLQGKLDFEAVVEHFCRVNGVSRAVQQAAYDEAYEEWEERNKYTWTQDFGEYSGLVPP